MPVDWFKTAPLAFALACVGKLFKAFPLALRWVALDMSVGFALGGLGSD